MVESAFAGPPPEVLVVVSSSGAHPFLDIEKEAQQPTFGSLHSSHARVLWLEGDPELARRPVFRFLNNLLGLILRNIYGPVLQVQAGTFLVWVSKEGVRGRRVERKNFFVRLNSSFFLDFFDRRRTRWNLFSRGLGWVLRANSSPDFSGDGVRVRQNFPNSFNLHPYRSFLRYRYVLDNYDFDFVLFTTSTCYVDLAKLTEVVKTLPLRRVYAGDTLKLGIRFVAGNSILMSRDVVERVVANRRFYHLDCPDDVALGRLVHDMSLADILHIPTETLPFAAQIPASLGPSWVDSYLFRCKAEHRTQSPARVVKIMWELHNYLLAQRAQK